MDTEGSNISSSFARNPEDSHVSLLVILDELALIDGSNSEFLLDSRDEWRSLEDSSSECLQSLLKLLYFVNLSMELDNGDVLLTGRLLGLDESSGVVDASNEAPSDLRIQSTTMTGLLNLQDSLDPSNDFMRRRV